MNPNKNERRNIMNRELLEKPFTPEQIKQRDGNFGKTLDYVEGHAIIQRLNDAFDAKWSFEILKNEVLEDKDEVIVQGKLTAENVVKSQFGSSQITRAKETGEIISIADDLKAAATDSLKKCATMLGVGLHLYNGDRNRQNRSGNNNPGQKNSQGKGNGGDDDYANPQDNNGGDNRNGQGDGRLTSKQYKYIMRLINEKGMTRKELNARCIEGFGVAADYLSKSDASSLIEELIGQ
jgi:hypothetical protein